MIYTGSFKDINNNYDEIWLIVRSLRKGNVPNLNIPIRHIPALSPSPDLFQCYLSWKNAGNWNKETFEKSYKPRFLHEMQTSAEAQGYLQILREYSETKNILLVCFCQDESLCHRSIIKQLVTPKPFYLLVAGSRYYDNYDEMCEKLDYLLMFKKEVVIVSGGARGADSLAERYAEEKGYRCEVFEAQWDDIQGLQPSEIGYKNGKPYRKKAGYERNQKMHEYLAQFPNRGCVCFWNGQSKGTSHNFELAHHYHTPLKIFDYTQGIFIRR